MKEKTKLRVIQILCIVSLLITVFSIQRTYAKYFEQVETTYATNIKRWVVNVNNKILREQESLNSVMTPKFFYNPHMDTNENLNNILVPGRHGCFEFLIDYTAVDVPFKFEFAIEQLNTAELADFEVYGYAIVANDLAITLTTQVSEIQGITTLTKTDGEYDLSGLTQTINPSEESNTKKRVLVLFKWNDDADNTMNNAADTAFVGEANEDETDLHTLLKYNVKITFTQVIEVQNSDEEPEVDESGESQQ